ncbi:TetR/AcrR family transcriptional regulator [Mycolicibacter arupensis]|jgi:AcrR family transcriptional regulator|uniref:Transcriptional regulator n=2 Tax=Mycolicibacter arupensis TaxID=342002 RepID=A0A0F5N278_9MYCO|nr:helix-turn-helix domain-containing protein [Mycolicibacter arupensis]KKC00975.1 transcriptional regulator [Mycolicibacter arupensis]ORA00575.1 TetR family transcriptional regulator [Mycolicibacter arupensis]
MNTQAEPKRRMSAHERREQLLDHARDIVAADGFAAVTIDRVARAAQVTRPVVYQNFGDLAGLMSALLDRESGIAFAGMRSVEGPPAEDPDAIGRGILAYLHAAPTSWRIILSPPAGAPPQLRARTEMGRRYARNIAAGRLSRLAGHPIEADGVTMRLLLSAVEELALLHLTDPSAHPDELVLSYLRSLVGWALRVETASAGAGR